MNITVKNIAAWAMLLGLLVLMALGIANNASAPDVRAISYLPGHE